MPKQKPTKTKAKAASRPSASKKTTKPAKAIKPVKPIEPAAKKARGAPAKTDRAKSAPVAKKAPANVVRPRPKAKASKTGTPKPPVAKAAVGAADQAAKDGAPQAAVLHALIIGCDYYFKNQTPEGFYPSLAGCVADAEQVEQFLRKHAALTDANLIKLTSSVGAGNAPKEPEDKQPTYENIVGAFRKLTAGARKGDHVYIHYSGHGGRCPTIVPQLKGREGQDETLVPVNIGDGSARYVRDVEIAKLLKEMADKGLTTTFVSDSCHSAGLTRAARSEAGVSVRGVPFVDSTPRPASVVGSPADLAAVVASVSRAATPESGLRGMAAGSHATGNIFLAACRPSELAAEAPFDGTHPQGALTYWLLQTAANPDTLTFRALFDTLQARIHAQFPEQTPMLFGDPDRLLLKDVAVRAERSIAVSGVADDGKSVTLASGQAGLVRVGDDFGIQPGAGAADRLAVVRIATLGAVSAKADVIQTFGARKPQVGDRAVPLVAAQKLTRRVRTVEADGAPAAAKTALGRVETALQARGWVQPAADENADFLVTTSKDGTVFIICDAAGMPLQIRPDLVAADPKAATAVVDRLVHLARFQAVRSLANPDPFSPLRGKLVAELFRPPANYREGDALPADLQPLPGDRAAHLVVDDWVVLSVTNKSSQILNVALLDLTADWSISLAQGDSTFVPIEPGLPWRQPLQADLPEGMPAGKDVLKLIATVDPPPAYDLLTLPPLDKPIASNRGPKRGLRSTGPQDPLAELIEVVGADHPTRALVPGSQPSRGWTVVHLEFAIRRTG